MKLSTYRPRWQKRVDAFTIPELLLSLLISSIVATMVYQGLLSTQAYFASLKAASVQAMQVARLSHTIEHDVFRSTFIKMGHKDTLYICGDGRPACVRYVFAESMVLRHQKSICDTFQVKAKHLTPHYLVPGPLGGVVDKISVTWVTEKRQVPCLIKKTYNPYQLITLTEKRHKKVNH